MPRNPNHFCPETGTCAPTCGQHNHWLPGERLQRRLQSGRWLEIRMVLTLIFVRAISSGKKTEPEASSNIQPDFWQLRWVRLNIQPNLCSTWLLSISNHRVLERPSGAMFLNEKPPMSMLQGKCACLRAKTVEISGHLPAPSCYSSKHPAGQHHRPTDDWRARAGSAPHREETGCVVAPCSLLYTLLWSDGAIQGKVQHA